MSKCTYNPMVMSQLPIGMFHCPLCGEMVLAGAPHPDFDIEISDTAVYECPDCQGTGIAFDGVTCSTCDGKKKISADDLELSDCAYCDGTGINFEAGSICNACCGEGKLFLGC